MPRVLILTATEGEISGFLDRYPGTIKIPARSGAVLYRSSKYEWDCLVTGPGVLNTAQGLTAYLETNTPGFIFQTGIAGVFEASGLGLGDMAIAEREQYLHTGVSSGLSFPLPLPFDLLADKPLTRQGIYLFDHDLVSSWHARLERVAKGGVVKGGFLTVSVITGTRKAARAIFDEFSPVMENMEGAAAAHVASLYQVDMVEVRAASNFVGERDKSLWDISLACGQVARICNLLLPSG